jgi:hypothetical protein
MAEAAKGKGSRTKPASATTDAGAGREDSGPEGQGPEDHGPEGHGQVCTVAFCPICLAVTAVQPLRPDAVEHLLNAGRELLLAMTAIVGARADETGGKPAGPSLTRIDIE